MSGVHDDRRHHARREETQVGVGHAREQQAEELHRCLRATTHLDLLQQLVAGGVQRPHVVLVAVRKFHRLERLLEVQELQGHDVRSWYTNGHLERSVSVDERHATISIDANPSFLGLVLIWNFFTSATAENTRTVVLSERRAIHVTSVRYAPVEKNVNASIGVMVLVPVEPSDAEPG